MATDGSLNQSMNKAKKHYSSLFFLPSFKTTFALTVVICILSGATSTVFFLSLESFFNGLLLGISLFAVNLAVDLAISKVILKDPIFVLRRTAVLSLFSWVFWFFFIVIGAALGLMFGYLWWVKLCLLGFATLLTLRTVVFVSVSSADFGRRLLAILLQPFACILPFVAFWASRMVAPIDYLPFIAVSPVITLLSAYFFIHLLDNIGRKTYNIPSINIFKAFMLNWVSALNAPLEEFLEKMGEDADIEVSILKFDAAKPKAALVVPLVHPGPFKNIGSSMLPWLLKQEYEKAYGANACIPLGLLGHELDAASQTQNYKIINQVIGTANFPALSELATPFSKYSEGFVTACCQIFGKTAFLSFTLAPKTTEDLPQELGDIVREQAGKLGLDAVTVNAHNSLTENPEIEASLDTLRNVATNCLQKAVSQKLYPFEVGAATIHPEDLTLKEGMGAGGITTIVVKVGAQKTSYVILDGNNMVSGMREKILDALSSAGFEESEVLTTDTHAVSAVVVGARGYHPLGEAIDQDVLIKQITAASLTAMTNLESCKAGYKRIIVPKVRVIGSDCLGSITLLVDRTIQKAKQIVLPIFAVEGLLLILMLALL